MSQDDRTEIISHLGPGAVDEIIALLADHRVEIVRQPATRLVMMPLIDSFGTEFNLGEVLVIEAAVRVDGVEGYGMVLGDEPRRVLARAAADAILRGGGGALKTCLENLLQKQRVERDGMLAQQRSLTAATRVNFDLMAGA